MSEAGRMCVLVPVYHPYRWVAPHMLRLLDEYWPDHPDVFFAGLAPGEVEGLPLLPLADVQLPRPWAAFCLEAVTELLTRGYELCYFIGEDHVPLGTCHARHLRFTLPELMESLPASYIGMMGWDNRRFLPRGEVVSNSVPGLRHLTGLHAPRFHLHPCLFRLSVLRECLECVSRQAQTTPWAFEKTCDKLDADLPERDKASCYQIEGEALALNPDTGWERQRRRAERFVYHRAMALAPWMQRMGLGMRYWDAWGFDNFFYNGPYPMFYSGVMSRGRLNPFFMKFVEKMKRPPAAMRELIAGGRAWEKQL